LIYLVGIGTIVVLMGVSQRATIARELLAGGLEPSTPIAAIESATTDHQIVGRWILAELADAEIRSPAVIVIGPVAALDLAPADVPTAVVQPASLG
jgi:siroheme synthase